MVQSKRLPNQDDFARQLLGEMSQMDAHYAREIERSGVCPGRCERCKRNFLGGDKWAVYRLELLCEQCFNELTNKNNR